MSYDGVPIYEVPPATCDVCAHHIDGEADERFPPFFNLCTRHIAELRDMLQELEAQGRLSSQS